VYMCRDFTCRAPATEPGVLRELLNGEGVVV
jgi:hypothetical protein